MEKTGSGDEGFMSGLFAENQKEIENSLAVSTSRVLDETADIEILLDRAVREEVGVWNVWDSIRTKYAQSQRLMMTCWNLEQRVSSAETVSQKPLSLSCFLFHSAVGNFAKQVQCTPLTPCLLV